MSDEAQQQENSATRYALPPMVGGPLHRLLVRLHLSGPALQHLQRRIVVALAITWLPLLVLAIFERNAWDGAGVPFFKDIAAQARLLVSLPLILAAETIAHRKMHDSIPLFVERGLIREPHRAQFVDAIASVRRWRDSSAVEWTLLGLVYAMALSGAAPKETLLSADSWHGTFRGDREILTLAGWWTLLVSLPFYQFLFARMYYRLVIWWRFLWLVSRMDLDLEPLHADRMGGLRFLSRMSTAFVPLFLAQGAVVAGVVADHIIFSGALLTDFQEELAAICVLMTVVALAPLTAFQPLMSRARLAGLVKYEALSTRYSRTFDRKWLDGSVPEEPLLGTADVQTLSDLGGSYEAVSRMHVVPLDRSTLVKLLCAILLPMLPLLLTMFSLKDLLLRAASIMF